MILSFDARIQTARSFSGCRSLRLLRSEGPHVALPPVQESIAGGFLPLFFFPVLVLFPYFFFFFFFRLFSFWKARRGKRASGDVSTVQQGPLIGSRRSSALGPVPGALEPVSIERPTRLTSQLIDQTAVQRDRGKTQNALMLAVSSKG